MPLYSFWQAHTSELWQMIERHVALVALSTLAAIVLGVPIGILAARRPALGRPLVAFANVAQTVPSLALLGFLLPLPFIGGVGPRVAVVALVLYALLPIVRSTIAGISSIAPPVTRAGRAMGMTSWQLLSLVELPLALPSIVSGIRVATVIGVGTATVAAAIGAGGLGEYIFRGLSMVDSTVILAGAIPAACLAITADLLLSGLERMLRPSRTKWRARVPLAAAAVAAAVLVVVSAFARSDSDSIVIGSKNFTEQVILGELLAQTLEAEQMQVTRRLNLGGTFICDRALRSGDIDLYPEYTGTALTAIFHEAVGRERQTVLDRTRRHYANAGVSVLAPFGFDNTFAILVRRVDAATNELKTIADLRRLQDRWRPGFGYEFVERADGYRGLAAAYELSFRERPRVMDLGLMYRALASREVDFVAGDATSAQIAALDLVVLRDDRGYFPPYDAVPVVRTATLLRHPRMARALAKLAGRVSAMDMQAMNRAVDVDHRDVATVVRQFLSERLATARE